MKCTNLPILYYIIDTSNTFYTKNTAKSFVPLLTKIQVPSKIQNTAKVKY